MQGVGGAAVGGGGIGGAPYKKNGGKKKLYARSYEGGWDQAAEGHQPSAGARSRRP